MPFCKICGEFMFGNNHVCPPEWEIWDDASCGDEFQVVHATSAEDAGKRYAATDDNRGDYQIANGNAIDVKIRKLGEEEWVAFELSAEIVADYHALAHKGMSTCPICKRKWLVTPDDDCLLPECGCFGHDVSSNNSKRLCEACGLAHTYTCEKMPNKRR